jgi:ParB-like chromosome segregation protein Spo0J
MNAKDQAKIDNTKASMKAGAYIPPVLCLPDGRVIDGAYRVIAARELGIQISIIVLDLPVGITDPTLLTTWMD